MIVDCAVYLDGKRVDDDVFGDDPATFVWIGLNEPTEDEFADVADRYRLHPLAVEDAIHAHQRPKIETYDDSLFVVLKTAVYKDPQEKVELGEIMLFVGERFVVSVRHGTHTALGETRRALEADPARLALGPHAVLHAVLDRVVDGYEHVLGGLDTDIDQIEEEVFSSAGIDRSERIFRLKREVLDFRRAVQPLVEPLRALQAHHPTLGAELRDVFDHTLRVVDRVEAFDAILSDALSANLAQVGVRQNEDMRKISAWVAIAAVPTMIAGIYGMNFEHMPELGWQWGYALALLLMAGSCLSLYTLFKRRDWL